MKPRVAVHVVRKAELAAGRARDWDDPEGLSGSTPQKREAMLANPFSNDDDDPMQLIGTQGQLVIGKIDLLAGQFQVGDQLVPTLWTSAYYVPEAFRTTLIGVMLLVELQRLSPTVSASGVSQMALPVFQKLKWYHFSLPRHLIVMRSRPVLNRWLGANLGSAVLSPMVDAGLRFQRLIWSRSAQRSLGGLRCERVERAGPELDDLLEVPAEGVVAARRSAAWLNWLLGHRFSDDPSIRTALFYVRDRDGRLVGYFLVKSRFYASASQRGFRDVTLGSLGDWMIFDPARLQVNKVVLLAVRALLAWKPDAVELCLESRSAGSWLSHWGFPHLGALHVLVRASPKSPLGARRLREQPTWRLRPAEGDNFFS